MDDILCGFSLNYLLVHSIQCEKTYLIYTIDFLFLAEIMYRSLMKWKNIQNTRTYCEVVTKVNKDLASASSTATEATKVKSYESIPGPRGIFGIGTLYQYLPVIGK